MEPDNPSVTPPVEEPDEPSVTPPEEVKVPEAAGGKVAVSSSSAAAGDVVTVTATPEAGRLAWSVAVTDADGKAVPTTPGDKSGTWTFTMPDSAVTVEVRFVCDGGDACAAHSLADVEVGAWYHDAVDWAVENGVMTGYDDGSHRFGPDDTLTRAQLASVLYKQAGCPEVDGSKVSGYTDCDASAWYAKAVTWATEQGLMTGYDDGSGRFDPDAELTREQLAVVFWRNAGSTSEGADLGKFPDGSETSSWAEDAVEWAVSTGLLKGYDNTGELGPSGDLTRAQMATVMYRRASEE
ncbi:S-layer homology domain-containing protein [Collinsella sp. An2]|uniref:S-layer homology domain-containing protein n=1 Tax=Collinsella sp. An2 TaxID=1965585 RepID=UPI001302B532|nr:S-layer homology domain-containing protein [Collinsella sp. An2]